MAQSARAGSRRAFSLVELVAVLVVMSIMAVAATPAFSSFQRLRRRSLSQEVERRLQTARAYALASSLPTGVRFDTSAQEVAIVIIATSGAAPTNLPGTVGGTMLNRIEQFAPSASLTAYNINGGTTYNTIWFNYRGIPHVRNASGAFVSNFTADATITLSGPSTVTVRRLTGAIER